MNSIVICEKPSQARNLRAAIGTRYGTILAARGHLLTLEEPHEANPSWKLWQPILLSPDQPYGKKPAGKHANPVLAEMKKGLRGAKLLIIATDCDREGLVIGREIADYLAFRGTIMRAVFAAEDPKTLSTAFENLVPISEFDGLYAAGKAREQADQIFNLSLTRTVTTHLGGHGKAIGIGRVRTPTLGIVCHREQEIQSFVPTSYFHVEAQCQALDGSVFTALCRELPTSGERKGGDNEGEGKNLIVDENMAKAIGVAATGWQGPIEVEKKPVLKAPPRPFDLSSLQGHMGSRFKWPAKKTLDVAQTLYSDLKLISYPRAECRYLPESQVGDAPALRQAIRNLSALQLSPDLPDKPFIRQGRGRRNHYSDAGLAGSSHHAIQPNINVVNEFNSLWQKCDADQECLATTIFLAFMEQTSEDAELDRTSFRFQVPVPSLPAPARFRVSGQTVRKPGWMAIRSGKDNPPTSQGDGEESEEENTVLPPLANGTPITVGKTGIRTKQTKPPARFTEGNIIIAMRDAWKFIPATSDELKAMRERLKDASGIGTPATRDTIIESLVAQGQLVRKQGKFHPTEAGLELYRQLLATAPKLVNPGLTAIWEFRLDQLALSPDAERRWWEEVQTIAGSASRAMEAITTLPPGSLRDVFAREIEGSRGKSGGKRPYRKKRGFGGNRSRS
ncbi:MAG: DNA topoisomerase [Paracoccaceae bacterium]|nr:DNA topoisomerase [Paracoccaceae bacterium]